MTEAQQIKEMLSAVLGDEMASAVIAHRKMKKCPLTLKAAQLQVKEYITTGNPIAAAEMQILLGWRAIKASWYFEQQARDAKSISATRTAPTQSANYGHAAPVERQEPLTPEQLARRRELAEMARATAQRMRA